VRPGKGCVALRILLDENIPVQLKAVFPGHLVKSVNDRDVGWKNIKNGRLLAEMESRFDLSITADRNMFAQQNLSGRNICILVLPVNRRNDVLALSERIIEVAAGMSAGTYRVLEKTGAVQMRSFDRSDDGASGSEAIGHGNDAEWSGGVRLGSRRETMSPTDGEPGMTIQTTISPDGERLVTMTAEDYQDLIDARDAAVAMRDIATGTMPTVADADLDAYLAAPTPLAFWRKHRGLTQAALSQAADISQPYLAQLENGQREGTVSVYARLARLLHVRIDDLVAEAPADANPQRLPPPTGRTTITRNE